jgi:Fe-S-cluster-containing dehydrogenase component
MLACAREVFKVFSWERSAIKVRTMGGLETGEFDITVCRRCEDPPCTEACPTGALYRGKQRLMKFDPGKCDGCRECVEACIVDAVTFDEEINKPRICIHCGVCARACPHEVLELIKIEVV